MSGKTPVRKRNADKLRIRGGKSIVTIPGIIDITNSGTFHFIRGYRIRSFA